MELEASLPLPVALSHLYVLIPVLDNDKHYWVGDNEVAKLLRRGEGWLSTHPARDLIARRYLKHRHSLVSDALSQLVADSATATTASNGRGRNFSPGQVGWLWRTGMRCGSCRWARKIPPWVRRPSWRCLLGNVDR